MVIFCKYNAKNIIKKGKKKEREEQHIKILIMSYD